MRLLTILVTLALAACGTTKTVPVPKPVVVEGPTRYVPVPAELTECTDTGPYPPKGAPTGELLAWAQRTRAALVECRGRMGEIRGLEKGTGK